MTEVKKHLDLNLDFLGDKKSSNTSNNDTANCSFNEEKKQDQIITRSENIRPWVRFTSRYIDIFLFSLILGVVWYIFITLKMPNSTAFGLLGIFLWMLFEPLFLSTFGATFGKWLFKIRVRDLQNNKLKIKTAFLRSFQVWFAGLAIGLPFFSLFTLYNSWKDLTKTGITSWDKDFGISVTHEKIGFIRWFFILLLITVFIALICYGAAN